MKLPYSTSCLFPSLVLDVVVPPSLPDAFDQAIAVAVENTDAATLRPVVPADAGSAFQPKALLAAIVRCYARQIYGSIEIEAVLARNTTAEPYGLTVWPDADTICAFRKHNRMAIQLCLMTALTLLAMRRLEAGTITRFNPTLVAEEARRRLVMAMFTDSLDLGAN